MVQYNGTTGDLTAGGSALEVTKWSAETKAETHDITDKASEGYREMLAGIKSCDLSAEGV